LKKCSHYWNVNGSFWLFVGALPEAAISKPTHALEAGLMALKFGIHLISWFYGISNFNKENKACSVKIADNW